MRQEVNSGVVKDLNISENEIESSLKLRLLGSFEVMLHNVRLTNFGSRKAQALLFYLVMKDTPVARDTLVALLWPEMTERAAKNNLRTTLAALNRQMAPYLDVTTSEIAFKRHLPYVLDVETFRSAVNAAISAQDLVALRSAVGGYRGEFLQGFMCVMRHHLRSGCSNNVNSYIYWQFNHWRR